MFGLAVARVIEHRRRRGLAPEGTIVSDVNPATPNISLAFGQDRHRRVIAMKPFASQNMVFNET